MKSFGPNEIEQEKPKKLIRIIFDIVREPIFLLLLLCSIIYFILGDLVEAHMLLAFVVFTIIITIIQEKKTENAVFALRTLSQHVSNVIREGKVKRIPGREIVPGDYILINEGDKVPADGIIYQCDNLMIDESLLTGESLAVRKEAYESLYDNDSFDTFPNPSQEQANHFAYSGTMTIAGSAIIIAQRTGVSSEIGKIGKSLKEVKLEKTPLEREMRILIVGMLLTGITLSFLLFIIYGLSNNDVTKSKSQIWLESLLLALALAMSLLPEEFQVVLVIFLALGAFRMSKKGVLVRHNNAIENLGAMTVLCTDKTGL
ncbi:MAG: putative P-type ATPase, translocating [Streblomastix strix]|uniref:Putative P-type ATPase, translocating n=1 Tax=Streblomastix strix TaxID=222440 RepID=A0A5J4WPF4_9EUKA|nr:MAG: putative P-type ATPase, translocating [Streblomastix strix]